MAMGIDEAGHDGLTLHIPQLDIVARRRFYLAAGTHFEDQAIPNSQGLGTGQCISSE